MGIQGMEVIAIAVVVLLFFLVLKQFGIWEPLSLDGKLKVTFNFGLSSRKAFSFCWFWSVLVNMWP